MGDHRASIKIEMEFHGIKDKADMWINWGDSTSEAPGVDQRIIDWFRSMHERGMEKYSEMMYESQKEDREKAERERELAELERLKKKYEK
jgi:hypothetical protein